MVRHKELIKDLLNGVLVYDIETSAIYPDGTRINIRTNFDDYVKFAKVKWVGAYSYKHNEYYNYNAIDDREEIIKLFSEHKTLVGFNNVAFDTPIMKNNGFFKYKKEIDVMVSLGNNYDKGHKNRSIYMGVKLKPVEIDGKNYGQNTLMSMAKHFNCSLIKGDIDYNVFFKESWSPEETKDIIKYLKADVEITKQLFDKLVDFWTLFTDWLYIEDIENWAWIKSSIASLTYVAACKVKGVKPTYGSPGEKEEMGGRAVTPYKEEIKGVHYLDEASKYPHIFAQFNLCSEVDVRGWSQEELNKAVNIGNLWHGNEEFKVKGYYDIREQGILEKDILKKLKTRIAVKRILKDYKKGVKVLEVISDELKDFIHKKELDDEIIKSLNGLQYAIKIFLNSLYGAIRSGIFEQIHSEWAGYDCCWIGQQIHEKTENFFKNKGYEVVGGFTDSWFVEAKTGDTKELMIDYCNDIISELKKNFIYPAETHIIDYETYMDYLLYNKDKKTLTFKKNNYCYIAEGKVKIVGFPIKKSNASKLGKLIFDKYLEPEALKTNSLKFNKSYIKSLIENELQNDLGLIAVEFKVNPTNTYKSLGQIQAQISREYFDGLDGKIRLIKNTKIGNVGKGKKYCTIEEAKKHNLKIIDLDLTKVWNELEPFLKEEKVKSIFDF